MTDKPAILKSQSAILSSGSLNSKSEIPNSKYPMMVTLCYMVVLFILSSIPGSGEGGLLMDRISPAIADMAHVPAYGLLALLWIVTLRGYGLAEHPSMWVAFLIASAYGALTELHQFWVPGRFPSVMDVLSNAAGSLLFIGLYWRATREPRAKSPALRVQSP